MLSFTIHARPQPKERARSTRSGHHYTPKRTVNFERLVAAQFRRQHPDHKPIAGPIELGIYAQYSRPRTVKKDHWHTGRGDIDNIVKAISDGLNGVAWKDDRQVASLIAQKTWGDADKIEVYIWELSE